MTAKCGNSYKRLLYLMILPIALSACGRQGPLVAPPIKQAEKQIKQKNGFADKSEKNNNAISEKKAKSEKKPQNEQDMKSKSDQNNFLLDFLL